MKISCKLLIWDWILRQPHISVDKRISIATGKPTDYLEEY